MPKLNGINDSKYENANASAIINESVQSRLILVFFTLPPRQRHCFYHLRPLQLPYLAGKLLIRYFWLTHILSWQFAYFIEARPPLIMTVLQILPFLSYILYSWFLFKSRMAICFASCSIITLLPFDEKLLIKMKINAADAMITIINIISFFLFLFCTFNTVGFCDFIVFVKPNSLNIIFFG